MSKIFLCALMSLWSSVSANVSPHIINRDAATLSENKVKFNDVVSATVVILYLCRPEDAEPILLLGGEYNEFLKRAFFNMVPVALIAESGPQLNALDMFALTRYSFRMYQNYKFIRYLRKAHRFIMIASSQPMLRSILQRTKDSPWANPYGFYILIDKKTESRGCINARSYLWTAWEYDLLSVIFLCIDPDDGVVYYTFNPYSEDTPASWLEVGRAKGRNGHPWIILKRVYVQSEELCKDLDFDKTTTLNGYEIRMNVIEMEPFIKINLNASDDEKFTGDNSEIIKILLHKLRATLSVEIYNGSIYNLGHIGPNGTLEGMLTALSDGRIDIGMNTRSLLVLWKLRYTYPHMKSGICTITQPSEEISGFVKLVTFMSPLVIIGILSVCFVTYVILASEQGCGNAVLQVIRLIVCVGILRPPKISSTRIFVCMTLFLLLNVNAMFQSRLSSLLTVPIFYKNINTLEDLKKSGYTVYGSIFSQDMISDPVIKERFSPVSYEACKEHVENSSTAACFEDCMHARYRIKEEDLHKSRMMRSATQSYVTREDWPLFKRVDRIIQRMMQTGLIRKSRNINYLSIQRAKHKNEAKRKSFKVMLLKQLAFCFYFLGIGYTCATMVFVMELVISRSAYGPQNRSQILRINTRRMEEAEANDQRGIILAWD